MRSAAEVPPVRRSSTGSDSRSVNAATTSRIAPAEARNTKISRHVPNSSSWAPMVGARIGATPTMSIRRAITLETAIPSYRSRTIASDSTIPAAAVKPCTNRSAVKAVMLSTRVSPTDAST